MGGSHALSAPGVTRPAASAASQGRWYYAISEVEFSRNDLTQRLAQLTEPVLSPTPAQPYEWEGATGGPQLVTPRTVWTNSIMFHGGQWMMYHGAGDTYVALATAPLRSGVQTAFAGTGFETGQADPDWVDQVDSGGGQSGNISNVGGPAGI